jgi:predicted Fe-Mo cluster-binding NifX family protein
MSGACIQSAQFLASKQVKTVLTGDVGPNALQALQTAGIIVYAGVSGTVKEVIERYRKGEFKVSKGANID